MRGEGDRRLEALKEKLSITRRAFLGTVGGVGAALGLGGLLSVLGKREAFLRPPGSFSEGNLTSLCLRCDRCIEVCPTGVITPVHITEDPACVNTPRLDFDRGYCDFCMKCVQVCPTGALRSLPEKVVKLGLAVIDPVACIAWNWVGCTRCLDLCPYEAIKTDEQDRPIVILDHCTGCGWCEYVCDQSSKRISGKEKRRAIFVVSMEEIVMQGGQ